MTAPTIRRVRSSIVLAAITAMLAVLLPATAAFAASITASNNNTVPGTSFTVTGTSAGGNWSNNSALTFALLSGSPAAVVAQWTPGCNTASGSNTWNCATTVPSVPGGTYTLRATDAGGRTASVGRTVAKSAALSVDLTSGAVAPGTTVSYTAKVRNAGPDIAESVSLGWTMDPSLTNIRVCPWNDFGSCKYESDYTIAEPDGSFSQALGPLAVGGTSTVAKVKVKADVPSNYSGLPLSTTASLTSSTAAPVTAGAGGNSDAVETPVAANADAAMGAFQAIRKSGSNRLTYAIRFINNGPADTQNLSLDVSGLDPSLTNLSYTVSSACSEATSSPVPLDGTIIPCGILAPGTYPRVDIKGTIAGSPAEISSTVTLTSANDPNAGNNSKTLTIAG